MKKLVTIVSAVMMLLMLAACVPSATADAEQLAAIKKGNAAITALQTYAEKKNTATGNNVTFSASDDITVSAADATAEKCPADTVIAKGASYEYTETDTSRSLVLSATVTLEDTTTKVEFSGSSTFNADGEMTELVLDYFKIDGVGYEPAFCTGVGLLNK